MIVFIVFSIAVLIFFYACEKSKINVIVTFTTTIIITYLMIYPKSSIESIIFGTDLFVKSVFPTLFPFLVLTNILIDYGGISIFGKILGRILAKPLKISQNSTFAIIISFICGYPLGIKYSNDLHSKNLISDAEFQRLSNIASNASPLFLIGTVGMSMLNNKTLGYILLVGNYVSCVLMSYLLPNKNTFSYTPKLSNFKYQNNLSYALKFSLENALKTCSIVGGFIILFSLVKEILINNIFCKVIFENIPILKPIIVGFFEITNGIDLVSKMNLSTHIKLSIISSLCSFSGLCIILQCYSFVHNNKSFKINKYILYKIIQAIISFLITFIISILII